jgi:hypothetical protein
MSEPWTDCPACPNCKLPCGSRSRAREIGYRRDPAELACCACGELWSATPEEWEQAVRADAAWAGECARQRAVRRKQLEDAGANVVIVMHEEGEHGR